MKSEAKNVDAYLEEVPPKRLEALKKLRALCREVLTDYEESMTYKMPSYKNGDTVEIAFASQKQYICFYVLKHQVMLDNKDLLKGLNHGKGCIRYGNPEKIDFELVRKLLEETVATDGPIC